MAFRLCREWGWPFTHPDRLLDYLSPDELADWVEYYALEPWGFEVEDLRFGQVVAAIFQQAGAKDVRATDFMMSAPSREEQSLEPANIAAMFGTPPPPGRGSTR